MWPCHSLLDAKGITPDGPRAATTPDGPRAATETGGRKNGGFFRKTRQIFFFLSFNKVIPLTTDQVPLIRNNASFVIHLYFLDFHSIVHTIPLRISRDFK